MYKIIITVIITFTLAGCGDSSSKKISLDETLLDKTSKRNFGLLADATVNIYELGDGEKRLLFTETTSTGQTVNEIGNFDPHFSELERDKFYLYEVKGGENMDADNDGTIDEIPVKNHTIYSAIYKGYKIHLGYRSLKTTNSAIGLSEKK